VNPKTTKKPVAKEKQMKRILIFSTLIVVAFILGFILRGSGPEPGVNTDPHEHAAAETQTQIWTCSMHPQIRMPDPGQCPICGMTLIPTKSADDDEVGERQLKLTPSAIKLAEIQTTQVERKYVSVEVRMVGKVDYDETRLAYITAWVPGRLDRLYVDYTGISVKKGDHMASLYSPELLTAQEELLQAKKAAVELKKSDMKIMRETAQQTIEASRDKLRLWGLTPKQIARIEKRGKASDHITIYAPIGGIVVHKNVEEGAYVKTGTRLYTIADLSKLWIKLDAYESDLMWIRYGQEVQIETEAYPGQTFKGTIAFIDPVLNSKTRTVKVRVNVSNKDGRLKPEMFVRTIIRARVAESGKVMDAALAGKWMCPMHPDIIKDQAGLCDICEMPIVRTETLGYAAEGSDEETIAPLVIPASAPLITGKRAVVYVAHSEKDGVFEGREVTLGPRAGNYYLVSKGLKQGEMVVSNGNFKIDSALQILAKPSMMSPEGGVAPPDHSQHGGTAMPKKATKAEKKGVKEHEMKENKKAEGDKLHAPEAFRKQIDNVLTVYFRIQEALAQDNAKTAQKESKNLRKTLDAVNMGLLTGHAHMVWMKDLEDLTKQAKTMKGTSDIKKQREAFYLLSESLTSVVQRFKTSGAQEVLQFHCPMAFGGRGAHWLQNKADLRNPYFGQMMIKCGEQTATLVTLSK
jgi:Cu(I)/Ag(I) efflux system membrane fusion protein